MDFRAQHIKKRMQALCESTHKYGGFPVLQRISVGRVNLTGQTNTRTGHT